MNSQHFFFKRNRFWISITTLLLLTNFSFAELQLHSNLQQTQLIELYTSEGCSSCPPADRWLSRYKDSPDLWRRVIPIAFHVDYWDYIGWTDRFANPAFSIRQRQHKSQGNTREVYTPGFVVNGNEWKGWYGIRRGQPPLSPEEPGKLSLTINNDTFQAQFDGINQHSAANTLTIAVLGFGLKTPVKAGENKGELLNHDFVVLALRAYPISADDQQWQGQLPTVAADLKNQAPLAIAAWVSPQHSLKPVQAVAGWLP